MKPTIQSLLIWLLGSSLLVLILALVLAHLPQSLKRLVLAYGIFGIACGAGMEWFARERNLQVGKAVLLLAVILVFLGGTYAGWTGYQRLKDQRAAELKQDPKQLAILNMLESISAETGLEEHQKLRRKLQPEFQDYLAFRVSRLGDWSAPWPFVFWVSEVSLAAALAGVTLFKLSHHDNTIPEVNTIHDLKVDK